MSAKQAATYHGADIVTRLRVQAPYSDDGQAMVEAAQEIEKLRRYLRSTGAAGTFIARELAAHHNCPHVRGQWCPIHAEANDE